jgi:hypothetical protein
MRVPKTAINEDHFVPRCEDNIRCSWQIATVQTKPISEGVEKPAHYQFRRCVFSTDARH